MIFLLLVGSSLTAQAQFQSSTQSESETLRVGVLKFGTVNWELQVVQEHALAEKRGIQIEVLPLASENALAVALQGGRVDLIVSDWLWAARQRQAGRNYQFAPYSLSVGAVMMAPQAGIASLEDLKGHKLGIAGGPVDKTWLLLRAYAQQTKDIELTAFVEPTYAAPPMINKLMIDGDLPAVINFWHYNARLSASGMRPLLTVEQMLRDLGIETTPPLLGWVFAEQWADENREALRSFIQATYEAKQILAESSQAWERLRPLVKPENEAVFAAIKEGYRSGIPQRYGAAEIEAAQRLFAILAQEGGEDLVGRMQQLDTEVFWDGFRLP
ncbi:ABC transporter substrate-binding protein [Modicisalibacter luteus]|nr:ABC transporter substrate-binding protein [Halomonas lutea]